MELKSYREILTDAVQREIEAYEFYSQLSHRVEDLYLRDMFRSFAAEELKHRGILEGFRDSSEKAMHFADVPDFRVAESVEQAALSLQMKPADAIALAMKKEEAAMRHYQKMAEACSDPPTRQIFNELAAMERSHKSKMEKAFVDIGYPEVW